MRSLTKRGILLPETLKILIAVLSIGILIYLASSLFGIFRQQTKLEQAKATLNEIVGNIDALKEGEVLGKNILILNPKDWWLIQYDENSGPKSCLNKNCLCICPELPKDVLSGKVNFEELKQSCDNQGVCKIPFLNSKISHISPTRLIENYLSFSYAPFSLFLELKNSQVEISYAKNEKDLDFFNNFLETKYSFTTTQKDISIKDQILFYSASGNWKWNLLRGKIFEGNDEMKSILEKNIQDYFKDYSYSIWVIVSEENKSPSTPNVFSVAVGKENENLKSEEVPSYFNNKYVIERSGEKSLIVEFIRRSD